MRFVATLVLAILWPIRAAGAQDAPRPPADMVRSLIAMEVRSFQRDLALKDWNVLMTHFWPAKVTARWEPPVESAVWASATIEPQAPIGSGAVQAPTGSGVAQAHRRCGEEAPTIAIVGRWARVLLPSCASRASELWMVEMSGRWRIVRLTLEQSASSVVTTTAPPGTP